MLALILFFLFAQTVLAQGPPGQQGQQNNNTECFFPSGKLHEKGIACGNSAVSSCCEPSQTCLSNGLCWIPASNQLARLSCTDKTWNSDLCPRWCTAEERDSSSELRQCSGSADHWVCGSRTDDCSRNFTVPAGQVSDERPFSQNGILQAGTCVADSSGGGGGPPGRPGMGGPPPFLTAGWPPVTTVTTTASPDGAALATALAAATAAGRAQVGDSGNKLATTVGLGVGLGVGLPLTCALIGVLFLWRRARQDAADARAELADLRDNHQRQHSEASRPKPEENQLRHPSVLPSPTPSPMHQRLPPQYGAAAEDKCHVYEAPHSNIHQLPGSADELAYLVEAPGSPHVPPPILNSATRLHHSSPTSVNSGPLHQPATPRQ